MLPRARAKDEPLAEVERADVRIAAGADIPHVGGELAWFGRVLGEQGRGTAQEREAALRAPVMKCGIHIELGTGRGRRLRPSPICNLVPVDPHALAPPQPPPAHR